MTELLHALTGWDWTMLVVVSFLGTSMAYLHGAKWKALLLTLPIPFTLASLALGTNVNTTHLLGLFLLQPYSQAVRWLHRVRRLPIFAAIGIAVCGYIAIAMLLANRVPPDPWLFWTVAAGLMIESVVVLRLMPPREEPGHRTPMPVWLKLPVITGIILTLIISKKLLLGFMTMFPMLGLVAAYEARHSLWTVCRTIPAATRWIVPMLVAIHVSEPRIGLGPALAVGWVVFLALFIPFHLRSHFAPSTASPTRVAP